MSSEIPIAEVSELIGKIYQAGLDGQWGGVMEELVHRTQSNKAFFVLQKLDSPTPLGIEARYSFNYDHAVFEEYLTRALEDPLLEVTRYLAEGESIYVNEHYDVLNLVETDFYKRIMLPLRSHYVLGGCLVRDGQYESVYAINRGPDDMGYQSDEISLIRTLTPHFRRAVQIYKDLTLYKRYSAISKSILDQSDKGVLVCDEHGRILLANSFANNELEQYDDIKVIGNQLMLSASAYQLRLKQCLKQCVHHPKAVGAQESILLERPGGETLLVTIAPLNCESNFVDIDQPCCLVTLTKQNAVRWAIFQKEFGLTPKELNLIQAINRKQKMQQLTLEMGVTYNTLATHLKAIYKKMGIHSQAELMVTLGLFRA